MPQPIRRIPYPPELGYPDDTSVLDLPEVRFYFDVLKNMLIANPSMYRDGQGRMWDDMVIVPLVKRLGGTFVNQIGRALSDQQQEIDHVLFARAKNGELTSP